tara:strand:- start:93 stop:401 length:309 start_codon:yes stop_codon:yes gene_type:complete
MFKKLIFLFLLMGLFSGCQSLREGLEGNKKSKSAEEFLIEKKNPLVLPPDYSKLPEPSEQNAEENNEFDLQKILETSESNKSTENTVNQSLKKSIIDKIKKN